MRQTWLTGRSARRIWTPALWILASGTLLSNSLSALGRGLVTLSLPLAARELRRALPLWLWVIFLSCMSWHLATGILAGSSAGHLAHDLSLMLLLPAGAVLAAEQRLPGLMRLFIWFGVLEALAVIWHAAGGTSLAALWEPGVRIWAENRPSGFLRSAPTSGQVLALILPLLVVYRVRSQRELWGFLVAGAVMGLALILTGTRSAWVSAGIVLFVVALLRFGWKPVLPAFFIGGLLIWVLLPANLRERALTITDTGAGWARCRTVLRESGIILGQQHPLFGIGPGRFKDVYVRDALPIALAGESGQRLTPEDLGDVRHHAHPHNDFIQAWAASGWPGLGLMVLLVCGVFVVGAGNLRRFVWSGRERLQTSLAGLAVFSGAVLVGLVDQTAFDPIRGNLFWLGAGLAAGRLQMSA
ncbi:MAG TPA: O-antigen ligase family protein [Spirochaetota bacterium]|nr:O-antigen ligase family protein [Spirochaetota bacterium]